jgi:hypothetical protein
MNARPVQLSVAFFLALPVSSGRALAAAPEPQPVNRAAPSVRKVAFTLLGGLVVPLCRDQQGCDGHLSTGPSLGGLVLYAPKERWAVGVAAQVSRVHWREPYLGMVDGKTYQIDSELTAGFAALAARYTLLPERGVTPIVQAALGAGFQTQTGTNFQCNNGLIPTGQLAIGGRTQTSASFSFFGLLSASWGFKRSECSVSDGPGATPFAGWGLGLHVGATFDVVLRS